jgi:hypothetical protein
LKDSGGIPSSSVQPGAPAFLFSDQLRLDVVSPSFKLRYLGGGHTG